MKDLFNFNFMLPVDQADKPVVGASLILAGIFPPMIFNSNVLQSIYFILLIPPAAYHTVVWFRKTMWPIINKLFKRPK